MSLSEVQWWGLVYGLCIAICIVGYFFEEDHRYQIVWFFTGVTVGALTVASGISYFGFRLIPLGLAGISGVTAAVTHIDIMVRPNKTYHPDHPE